MYWIHLSSSSHYWGRSPEHPLVKIGSQAVAPLIEALADESVSKRCGAAVLLGQMGVVARAAVPALRESVQAEDEPVRFAAAIALWRIDRQTEPVVRECILGTATDKLRFANLLDAVGVEPGIALPALINLSRDPDAEIRQRAAEVLRTNSWLQVN